MITKLMCVNVTAISKEDMIEAGNVIKAGGLVAFPTETVYGLGGNALSKDSSKKIYAAKGRPSDNPLIVHISQWESIHAIVTKIPENAKKLADAFWPGPLTMIFEKSQLVPFETTGGLSTVAIRMPNHPVALAFIEEAGGYIAAPSANTSGKPSPTLASHVVEDMNGKIELIIDGGLVGIGLESTIIDLTSPVPTILRPGFVTEKMLCKVLGEIESERTMKDKETKQAPKAPGMKYKHYAPKGELTIVEGNAEEVITKINELTKIAKKNDEKVGVIGTDETVEKYVADSIKSVGKRQDEAAIARHLYGILRDFDKENVSIIYSESFQTVGMGQAIMNRLLKAAAYKLISLNVDE
ncbi:MAG TPA: L-threonylcarbamoyladenylate synthase [Lachnospiraceae bacterium]|nr:L-threonylcarbamoyladenylate synthase [Lachnospiraceae bacterium]